MDVFGLCEAAEAPEVRASKLHTQRAQVGIEPTTLLVRGNAVNTATNSNKPGKHFSSLLS